MKLIIIFSLCVIACTAEFYKHIIDDYTPERLKKDHEEIKRRTDCYLERQPCKPLYAAYKGIAKEVLSNSCEKCSPALKTLIQAYLNGLKEKYPEDYREIIVKYDSSVTKFNALEKAVGVLQTIFASLPKPSLPSLQSLPSIPTIPSIPSLPSLQSIPSLPTLTSNPSLPSLPSLFKP